MVKYKLWNNFDGFVSPARRFSCITPFAYSSLNLDGCVNKYQNNGQKKIQKGYFINKYKEQNKITTFQNRIKIQ